MNPTPLVSICIPTFSRFAYLREAVASAQAQTHSSIEIVIGDDGDCRDIREWSTAEASRDARVRYQKNERRLGLAGNWNAVARAVRGEYLTIIGDDDMLLPEFAKRLLAANATGAAFGAVFESLAHRCPGPAARAGERRFHQCFRSRSPCPRRARRPARWVWRNAVPMSSSLIRAVDVKRLLFKEDLNTPEVELFARLAAEGDVRVRAGLSGRVSDTRGLGDFDGALVGAAREVPRPDRGARGGEQREFMGQLLLAAVTRALEEADTRAARDFVAHR